MAATLAWPEARHWLVVHIRCIITAHRVRTGCAQAWIQTRSGKLPIILLTRPQPWGERIYIWCRAGICPEDFEAARNVLRSACWASDIGVTPSIRYSHIVILDLIHTDWRLSPPIARPIATARLVSVSISHWVPTVPTPFPPPPR